MTHLVGVLISKMEEFTSGPAAGFEGGSQNQRGGDVWRTL